MKFRLINFHSGSLVIGIRDYLSILHIDNISVLYLNLIFPSVFPDTGSKWMGAYKLMDIRLNLSYRFRQMILEGTK